MSSSSEPGTITAQRVGKMYTIQSTGRARTNSLREAFAASVASTFKRNAAGENGRKRVEEFWALRDVSFDIRQGEVVGIIGRNGAGKSTLLKLLSQITEPSEGRMILSGRVASLLEVGTGFHQELSGRENIYLNGAMLGMSGREVRQKFDEIVDFAEIGRFLDTPVKRYSSGMYVRLAFAIAAHLEPEILVVDEVLAVGDAEFQRKCLGRMGEVAQSGRTVLFVSHNMATVQRLCTRGFLLAKGRLEADGPIDVVIDRYMNSTAVVSSGFSSAQRSGTGWARIQNMKLLDSGGHEAAAVPSDSELTLDVQLAVLPEAGGGVSLRGLVLELIFYNERGQPLTSVMNVDDPAVQFPDVSSATIRMRLPAPTFVPGRYRVGLVLGIPYLQHVDELVDALEFEITPPAQPWRPYDLAEARGNVCLRAEWTLVDRP